jgi:N utilization substance protein A
MKITYDNNFLQIMRLFEKVTRVSLKDAYDTTTSIFFIVNPGNLIKALGKNRENVTKLQEMLGRRFKIVEYNSDILKFVKNVIFPYKVLDITQEGNIVTIKGPDMKTKGLIIGAKAQNLRNYESIVKKYFTDLEEIKVV